MNFQAVPAHGRIKPSYTITTAQVLRRYTDQSAGLPTTNVRGTKGAGQRF